MNGERMITTAPITTHKAMIENRVGLSSCFEISSMLYAFHHWIVYVPNIGNTHVSKRFGTTLRDYLKTIQRHEI